MSRSKLLRIISLMLVVVIVLPTAALADIISSGGPVVAYQSKSDDTALTQSVFFSYVNATRDGSWYYIPEKGYYVKVGDVQIIEGDPAPTTTPVPTATPDDSGIPAVTAPPKVETTIDPNYSGTVLTYTVKDGGLSIYDAINGTVARVLAKGQTIKFEATNNAGWYSVSINGVVYYVPVDSLTVKVDTTTVYFKVTNKNGLGIYTSGDSSAPSYVVAKGTTIALTPIPGSTEWYSTYISGTEYHVQKADLNGKEAAESLDTVYGSTKSVIVTATTMLYTDKELTKVSENELVPGTRYNVKYVTYTKSGTKYGVFQYTIGKTNYFFDPAFVDNTQLSEATVGDSGNTELMMSTKLLAGAVLYYQPNATASTFVLPDDATLKISSENDDWYRVAYGSETLYLPKKIGETESRKVTLPAGTALHDINGVYLRDSRDEHTTTAVFHSTGWYRVILGDGNTYLVKADAIGEALRDYDLTVENEDTKTATFFITIGSTGASLYTKPDLKTIAASSIPAGSRVLAGAYNTNWYTYVVYDNTTGVSSTYYIHKNDLAYANSESSMGALKVYFADTVDVYESRTSNSGIFKIPTSTDYVVYSVDSTWYSIIFDGKTYYVKKADAGSSETPIPSVTTGKQYSITIGAGGGDAWEKPSLSGAALYLGAGTVHLATKYTENLYKIDGKGVSWYVPLSIIATINKSDDAKSNTTNEENDSASDIAQGQKDPQYNQTVLQYKIPSSGIWLYKLTGGTTNPTPVICLTSGTINLTTIVDSSGNTNPNWFTTWYGGAQYYVATSVLAADEETDDEFSIVIKQRTTLYSDKKYFADTAANRASGKMPFVLDSGYATSNTLAAGTRVNVTVIDRLTSADVAAAKAKGVNTLTKGAPKTYSTKVGTKTFYFQPFLYNESANTVTDNVDVTSIVAALVGDSGDTGLVTKFTTTVANATLYMAARTTSGTTTVRDIGTELYGVLVEGTTNWYKVLYNNKAWYLQDVDPPVANGGKLVVSGEVKNNTYAIVTKAANMPLYVKPDTKSDVEALVPAAGTVIMASEYSSGGWYATTARAAGVGTSDMVLYFRNTDVVSSSPANSLTSYTVDLTGTLPAGESIPPLYTTIADAALPSTVVLSPSIVTFRKIDSTWSYTTVGGKTYYVRNADIPASRMAASKPVASTTVGKTYKVVVGSNGATAYRYSSLGSTVNGGTPIGTVEAGKILTATKMYDAEAASTNGTGLVYQISFSGATAYIDAAAVVALTDGDEIEEAEEAGQEPGAIEYVQVGKDVYVRLNIGTLFYEEMDTDSIAYMLPSTGTFKLTKVNSKWFSFSYAGNTMYIPADIVEKEGTNEGSGIAVGTEFMRTITGTTPYYYNPTTDSGVVGNLSAGMQFGFKKISDTWYQTSYNGKTIYVTGTALFGAPSTEGTNTNGTTDGTGIITEYILISPSSGSVNMRKTASLKGTILDRIPKGTQVINLGYEKDDQGQLWYKTTYKNKTGYVIGDYVSPVGTGNSGGTTGTEPSADIGKTLTVNVVKVNVRAGAGTSYSIVGNLERNATIVPLAYSMGSDGMYWYQFQLNASTKAWIRYDYLNGGAANNSELTGNVAIKSGGTNLRSGAGDTFTLITRLNKDEIVTIIGSGTDKDNVVWYKITLNGVSGYVRHDLVRVLTTQEQNDLQGSVTPTYAELKAGSRGDAVKTLQLKLISLGYLASGQADGIYGTKTTTAVKAFQQAKGLTASGIATSATQALMYNNTPPSSGSSTQSLDWFTTGVNLLSKGTIIQIYDIRAGISWTAKFINGAKHADVVPNSTADANKLKAASLLGSYVRRPVITTINGVKYAGSMYMVPHGTTNYVSYFNGVVCLHFTGSMTHTGDKVDTDHQAAIQEALNSGL